MASSSSLRLGSEWTLVPHSADDVELRTGVWNSQVLNLADETGQGSLWPILKRLREGASAKDIARDLKVSRLEVDSLIDQLTGLGVMEAGPRSAMDAFAQGAGAGVLELGNTDQLMFFGDNNVHTRILGELSGELEAHTSLVKSSDALFTKFEMLTHQSFADGLSLERVREEFSSLNGSLVVFALEHNNPIKFQLMDLLAHAVGFKWIHATIDGPFLYVGPTVVPGRTANYRSFETRVAMNLRESESYLKYKTALVDNSVVHGVSELHKPVVGLLSAHVALELTNWILTGTNFTTNKVLGIYLPTMEIAYHEIFRLPNEGVAGTLQNRDAPDLYFDVREWFGRNSESR